MPTIALLNRSSVLTDDEGRAIADALQIQVSRDLAPIWDVDATMTYVGLQEQPPSGAWWLQMLDTADLAGVLGYHELTPDGLPAGKAFLKTTQAYGGLISVPISHELVEMLADPHVDQSITHRAVGGTAMAYDKEIADPTEDDQWSYPIGPRNIMCSDFVTPLWFGRPGSDLKTTLFDLLGHCKQPFEILSGGYMMIAANGGAPTQITADKIPLPQFRPHVGSRRERRYQPREHWQRSTAS